MKSGHRLRFVIVSAMSACGAGQRRLYQSACRVMLHIEIASPASRPAVGSGGIATDMPAIAQEVVDPDVPELLKALVTRAFLRFLGLHRLFHSSLQPCAGLIEADLGFRIRMII